MTKPALRGDEGEDRKKTAQAVLDEIFRALLPLLHPFIPFVTEELWEAFDYSAEKGDIMKGAWPKPKGEYRFESSSMQDFQEAVRILRNLRAEAHVPPQQWLGKAAVRVDKPEIVTTLKEALSLVSLLCRVKEIEILPVSSERQVACLSTVFGEGEISLYVGDVLDIDAEVVRLKQDLASIEKTVAASQSRLDKPDFISRAPSDVVEKERARVAEGHVQMERLQENIKSLAR
jgi:valyl-tRNA synthetase